MNVRFSNPLHAVPSTMQNTPKHRPIPFIARSSVIEAKVALRVFDSGAMK
jgi:hypothetical protein